MTPLHEMQSLFLLTGAGCTLFGWFAGRAALRRQHDQAIIRHVNRMVATALDSACSKDKIILFDVEAFKKELDSLIAILKSIHP